MKVLTFTGRSPMDALKKAKAEVGEDGLLIETREIQPKSQGREPMYEIVIGIEESDIVEKKDYKSTYVKVKKPLQEQKTLVEESEDIVYDISHAARQMHKVSNIPDPLEKYEKIPKPPINHEPKELKAIKTEIDKIDDKIKLIQNMFWNEKKPTLEHAIPPEFAEIYKLAAQSGMNAEHLNDIMKMTLEHMPSRMRENSKTVRRYFQTILRKLIPVRMEKTPTFGKKQVKMLVGPTGVGKTTSIAKLAARYSFLMQKKYKVGLVVLDTYRIGAVEQLMQYARMMRLSIETVVDPPEFSQALNSLSHCDYILIDTMGSSPYDRDKIEKIYECLESNSTDYQVDVTLVMPSSIKYEDLKVTYEKFEALGIDTMMFTKLDETMGFGNIFSLSYETRKPISYFSVGQEVPEDLVVASSDFLVDCLLNGFNRSKA